MASTPSPRSFQEIRKRLIQEFVSEAGLTDLNKASAIASILEAAAASDFRSQADIIASLNSIDIDRAEGVDLDNIGIANGVSRPQAQSANGVIRIKSTNFSKISTKVYAGTAAPPIGSLSIKVSDATDFPTSGQIYIGRGSNNFEGPLTYSSITIVGNYYQINLSSPTTKNHNVGESVILAQGGNRVVESGTTAQTKANNTSAAVLFKILQTVTIPDGEVYLDDVPVVCTQLGTTGNVPAGAIQEFSAPPFTSASAENLTSFVSGKDKMSDIEYRLLIKQEQQNKVKGTDQAVKDGSVGVSSTDDNKVVTSASIRKPANREEPAILFIDDGTVYEPIFSGQGFEQLVDNANGGERFLQLQKEDLVKAISVSTFMAPFTMTGAMKLAVKVGGILSEHTFADSDFATANAADAFEVVNSINSNTDLLFSARLYNNGKQVTVFSKAFKNEDVEVVSPSGSDDVDANQYLGLSNNLIYTLRLYKNDALLIKDGSIPTIFSKPKANWLPMSSPATLSISINSTPYQNVTITDADFVDFGYPTVATTNSIESWASVLQSLIAGVDIEVSGSQLKFTSSRGASNTSDITVLYQPGANDLSSTIFGLASTGDTLHDQGQASDYALNRSTGQIQLVKPLIAGDTITAGSKNTRGFVDSSVMMTGSVSLTAIPEPKMWLILDRAATNIKLGLTIASTITITNPSGDIWQYASSVGTAFSNATVGDWLIVADEGIAAANNKGFWRIIAKPSNSTVQVQKLDGTVTAGEALLTSNKIVVVRSIGSIQEVILPSGLQSLADLSASFNSQLQGAFAAVINGKKLRLTSNTFDTDNGNIFIAGFAPSCDPLGFIASDSDAATISHTGFSESGNSDLAANEFIHDAVAAMAIFTIAGGGAVRLTNIVTITTTTAHGLQNGDRVYIKNVTDTSFNGIWDIATTPTATSFTFAQVGADTTSGTGTVYTLPTRQLSSVTSLAPLSVNEGMLLNFKDAFAYKSNNKDIYASLIDMSGTSLYVRAQNKLRDLIAGDRFHVMSPFNFNSEDGLVIILDQDGADKSLSIPLSRSAEVSPAIVPTTDTLRAYDIDFGPTANFVSAFGNNFDFNDFKVHFKARQFLDPAGANNKMILRCSKYGPTGNNYKVGIFYPSLSSQPMAHEASVSSDTKLNIILASGADRVGGSWDNTTQFNVTNPSGSTYRYTWNGVGTDPNFAGASIVVGDIVNVAIGSPFASANEGVFRVTAINNTLKYFEVFNPSGSVESNIQLSATANLKFYELNASSNKATDVASYISGQLSDYIEATQLESGAGVISTSTFDDNAGSSSYVQLIEGENWIYSSNIGTNILPVNEFKLKIPITITGSDLIGEKFKIIPTVSDHLKRFLNTFAVTGLSSLGNIGVSDDAGRIQIYSNLFGSSGAVQVSGGTANAVAGAVISSGQVVDTNFTRFGIDNANRKGIHSGQWMKVFNISSQAKSIGLTASTVIQVDAGNPTTDYAKLDRTVSGTWQTLRTHSGIAGTQIKVEPQGKFTLLTWTGTGTALAPHTLQEGDWLRITGPFHSLNQGIFQVVKTFGTNSIYIENPSSYEEFVTLAASTDLIGYSYDSVMPGDVVKISGPIVGISNQGEFEVSDIVFPTNSTIYVKTTALVDNAPVALGSNYTQFQVIEKAPFKAYKKVQNIGLDPSNSNNSLVVLKGSELANKLNSAVGGGFEVLGKLEFDTRVLAGEDSYKYYGGLIHAVGVKIRGSSEDPVSNPGIAASGSYIEIDSALPYRVQLAIVIRNVSGTPFSVLKTRVQSTVSSYINALGVGKPVVFSEIISAIQELSGVQAVSISSPLYDSSHDQIAVSDNSKAVIKDINSDVIVSLAT